MLGYPHGLEAANKFREPGKMGGVGLRIRGERERDAMQRNRMPLAYRRQPREARPAIDHVVLGMNLEPEAVGRSSERGVVVRRLEAQADVRGMHRGHARSQPFAGVSEPMPLGVLIAVHVPLATKVHALP